MNYQKGDIVIINFPFSDLSRVKKRPSLIISNDIVNQTGDYLMVQITSKIRNDEISTGHGEADRYLSLRPRSCGTQVWASSKDAMHGVSTTPTRHEKGNP